jgi:hypothetical protein
MLTQLSDRIYFSEEHWQELWKNNRFEQIIRSSIDDQRVLGRLFQMGCQTSVPHYIPKDIALKLNQLKEDGNDLVMPEIIETFEIFAELLKEIRRKSKIPIKFKSVLTDSIEKNKILFDKLEEIEILELFKWDYEQQVFPEAIEMNRIVKAVHIIDNLEENYSIKKETIDINRFNINFDEKKSTKRKNKKKKKKRKKKCDKDPKPDEINESENSEFSSEIHPELKAVFGDTNKRILSKEFVLLSSIIEKPNLIPKEMRSSVANVMPYLIQRIKMWGSQVLTADNISGLINAEENIDEKAKLPNFSSYMPRFDQRATSSSNKKLETGKKEKKIPLSRFDVVVGIINSVDAIVGQDLLKIMAKFPISLPLIVRELHDKDSFKVFI